MIYSGYEGGHYFVRFTHDVRVIEAASILHDGYKIFAGHMLLVKKREFIVRQREFRLHG
jgi:hypothetical protein